MPVHPTKALVGLVLASVVTAGCVGEIDFAQGGRGPGGSGNGSIPSTPGSTSEHLCETQADSAPALLRRLTNVEYARTVESLLGLDPLDVSDLGLPQETTVEGFLNNAEVQTLSPQHVERYLTLAERFAAETVASEEKVARIVACDPEESSCFDRFVGRFGRLAFRRAITEEEREAIRALAVAHGENGRARIEVAIAAMLAAPSFLFRAETGEPLPENPQYVRLDGSSLATRIAFLGWGAGPDETLLDMADGGRLSDAAGRRAALAHVLDDPRAKQASREFFRQWLKLHTIDNARRDTERFPEWNASFKAAIQEETLRLTDALAWSDRPIVEMLVADHTYVNAELARFYGFEEPATDFQRVAYPSGSPRRGLLTQASFLAVTSVDDHASVVHRGLFVREMLMCQKIPSPPPGITENFDPAASLEQHLNDPGCMGCHELIDPIGKGFRAYDAIGRHRTTDYEGRPIDESGWVKGIEPSDFDGPKELAHLLAARPEANACVARQLFRFANGRHERGSDECAIAHAFSEAGGDEGLTYRALLESFVASDAFLFRRLPQASEN